jgi:hypothetical protein
MRDHSLVMRWPVRAALLLATLSACPAPPTEPKSALLRAQLLRGAVDSIELTNLVQQDVGARITGATLHAILSSISCSPVTIPAGGRVRVPFPMEQPQGSGPTLPPERTAVIEHCLTATHAEILTLRVTR